MQTTDESAKAAQDPMGTGSGSTLTCAEGFCPSHPTFELIM